jgi:integrase/recombinase XerD
MPHDHNALIGQLRESLTQQRYNAGVVHNYCRNADYFLRYLARRDIAVEAATLAQVSQSRATSCALA